MTTPCVKSELDLFSLPPVQAVEERGGWTSYYPTTSLDGTNMIEFYIPAFNEDYIDVANTFLNVQVKVTKSDGTPVTGTITPVNNLLSALFSDVSLHLNEEYVESSANLYPYKALINMGLFYNPTVKECQFATAGWNEDQAARQKWFANGNSKEFIGSLHLDFFNQPKPLISKVSMRIKLTKNKDNIILVGGADQKVVIERACLFVRKIRMFPVVSAAHEEGLLSQNANFPIQQSSLMTYTIPAGSTYHMQENILRGQLPKLIIVGLVSSKDFAGGTTHTPLRFINYGIKQISLQLEGQSVPFYQPPEMDWTSGKEQVTRAYAAMFQNLQLTNKSNGITLEKFIERWTLFPFNLCADLNATGSWGQPFQSGNLRLEMKFASGLTEGINVIVLGTRDGRIEITKLREIKKT